MTMIESVDAHLVIVTDMIVFYGGDRWHIVRVSISEEAV